MGVPGSRQCAGAARACGAAKGILAQPAIMRRHRAVNTLSFVAHDKR